MNINCFTLRLSFEEERLVLEVRERTGLGDLRIPGREGASP